MPAFVEDDEEDSSGGHKYFRAEVHLLEGGQDYNIMGWSTQAVIDDIIDQYERHMHYLHLIRDEERSEEHTSELQSRGHLVCRLLLEKKNHNTSPLRRRGRRQAVSARLRADEHRYEHHT